MVSITIDANTTQELLEEVARLLLPHSKTLPAGEANAKPAKSLGAKDKVEKAAQEETSTIKEPKGKPQDAPTPFGEVSECISALVSKAGKPATVKLLADFQVKRASELKAEQYAPFLTAAKKLLS